MDEIKLKKRSSLEKEAYYVLKIAKQDARISELEVEVTRKVEIMMEAQLFIDKQAKVIDRGQEIIDLMESWLLVKQALAEEDK